MSTCARAVGTKTISYKGTKYFYFFQFLIYSHNSFQENYFFLPSPPFPYISHSYQPFKMADLRSKQNIRGGVQGWRSGESTRLPPMWLGFDSRLGVICGLSLMVLYSASLLKLTTFDLIYVDCFSSSQMIRWDQVRVYMNLVIV